MLRDKLLDILKQAIGKFGFRYEGEFVKEVEARKYELVRIEVGAKGGGLNIFSVVNNGKFTGWEFENYNDTRIVCTIRDLNGKEFEVWMVEEEGKLLYWGKVICDVVEGKVVGVKWEWDF